MMNLAIIFQLYKEVVKQKKKAIFLPSDLEF